MLKTFDNGICIGGLNVAGVAMFLFATIASTLSAFPLLLSWLGLSIGLKWVFTTL